MFTFASVILVALVLSESVNGVYIYSSFWAPLFNPRILNYRVDAPFDPDVGKIARFRYNENYGYRGKNLIEELGNGKAPNNEKYKDEVLYGPVRFYYTFPGAKSNVGQDKKILKK